MTEHTDEALVEQCKPRKWSRKALKRSDLLGLMKWRYWHKVNGGHSLLWANGGTDA